MGFRIHCDACGKFMKTVGIREIRDMNYSSEDPTHCNECQRKFTDLTKQIVKLQRRYTKKLDDLANKATEEMARLISNLAVKREKEDAVDEEREEN